MESTSLIVIGRHNYPVEAATFKRRFNRPGNHRLAAKVPDILAMDALAATTGGVTASFISARLDAGPPQPHPAVPLSALETGVC